MVKLCSCNEYPYFHTHDGSLNSSMEENNKNDYPDIFRGQLDIAEGCDKIERKKLVGFCEKCDNWYRFIDDDTSKCMLCPNCFSKPSHRNGFQITTQRSFNKNNKKLKKHIVRR